MRNLLAMPEVSSVERLSLYALTIALQWPAAALIGWRCWARGISWAELGLVAHDGVALLGASLIGAAILAFAQWKGWQRKVRARASSGGVALALAERILPRSTVELLVFFAVAATAGVCEEFIYRGFAMSALSRIGLPLWFVAMATSLLFGLGHLYQGRKGVIGTAILGILFAGARIGMGSLIPGIVWHATIDATVGIAWLHFLPKGSRKALESS